MTRAAAAVLALMLATPAAAACRTVPEIVSDLKGVYPTTAFVAEISPGLVPTVLAWLESEGLPHRADRIVQVVGNRCLGLVLVAGDVDWDCDGTSGVELIGDKARELAAFIRRYRELKGFDPEYAA